MLEKKIEEYSEKIEKRKDLIEEVKNALETNLKFLEETPKLSMIELKPILYDIVGSMIEIWNLIGQLNFDIEHLIINEKESKQRWEEKNGIV